MAEAATPAGANGGSTDPTDYYNILKVPRDATAGQIKKAYFKLAVQYHPDKNQSEGAEAMFKSISEAYQVLTDQNKREVYDKYGKAGVQAAEGETAIDPSMLFTMLFGGGKFDDYFGELSFATMMHVQVDPKLQNETDEKKREVMDKKMEETQQARHAKLLHKLLIKIEPYVQGVAEERLGPRANRNWAVAWIEIIDAEIADKLEAPGGAELLDLLGYVYVQEAQKCLSRYWGLQSFWQQIREKGHVVKEVAGIIGAAAKLSSAQKQYESAGGAAGSEGLQQETLSQGMATIWRLGKFEIERMVRSVCEAVLQDPEVADETKRLRAKGLEALGRMFSKAALGAKQTKDSESYIQNLAKSVNSGAPPESFSTSSATSGPAPSPLR